MNVGTNERNHPISSPVNSPSPRQSATNNDQFLGKQEQLEFHANISPAHSPSPSPFQVDRLIMDGNILNRRPSDEASIIPRKIVVAGMRNPQMGMCNMPLSVPGRGGSLPHNVKGVDALFAGFDDSSRFHTLGLSETGRMVTALSESYLPNMGLESSSEGVGGIDSGGGMHRFLSLNNSLMPTLSMQDRHPSAPQLASMLASSSVERKPLDMLIEPDEHIPMRKRSWSMPGNAPLHLGMAPQISISIPDDSLNQFVERASVTIGESTSYNTVGTFGELGRMHTDDINKVFQQTGIPTDPSQWTEEQVMCWVEWTVREFHLNSIDPNRLRCVNGQGLCSFTSSDFLELGCIKEHGQNLQHCFDRIKALAPSHPHSDLVFQNFDLDISFNPMISSEPPLTSPHHGGPTPAITIHNPMVTSHNDSFFSMNSIAFTPNGGLLQPPPYPFPSPGSPSMSDRSTPYSSPAGSPMPSPCASPLQSPCPSPTPQIRTPNPSGSGPIQLWQFLLELLTDRDCQNCISWTGKEWEFKLIDPEEVAHRWGARKNKPKMNYEKLSRGLRYYYDKNIIHKVPGKRYVYRFVCELESILGMSFGELQHQLKGDMDSKPIKIERQQRTFQPHPLYGPPSPSIDMQNLRLNSSPVPSSQPVPYSMSPVLSPVNVPYGPYMTEFN